MAIAGIVASLPAPLLAQRALPIHEEPRHRPLARADGVDVLDVVILPGDTTRFHVHDVPILYVRLAASAVRSQVLGGAWQGGAAPDSGFMPGSVLRNPGYGERPVTHRVANVGTGPFRLIAVTNRRPRGRAAPAADPTGRPPGVVEDEDAWFRVTRLGPGHASGGWHRASDPLVIVALGDGRVRVAYRDGWSAALARLGDAVLLAAGTGYRLEDPFGEAPELVFVEVR